MPAASARPASSRPRRAGGQRHSSQGADRLKAAAVYLDSKARPSAIPVSAHQRHAAAPSAWAARQAPSITSDQNSISTESVVTLRPSRPDAVEAASSAAAATPARSLPIAAPRRQSTAEVSSQATIASALTPSRPSPNRAVESRIRPTSSGGLEK